MKALEGLSLRLPRARRGRAPAARGSSNSTGGIRILTDGSGLLSRILPFVYAAIAIVAVWQLALVLTGADPAILPPPLLTGETFVEMVASGEIFEHAGMSLGRVFVAWLMAACVAIPLGLAMGRFRMFERMLDPVVELFRPISPLAWIPMAIIWFGIGEGGEDSSSSSSRPSSPPSSTPLPA